MRKALDFISVLSFLISASMAGGIFYSYLYIKNPENQEKTKGFIKKEIKKMLPDVMPKIPTSTGKAIPTKPILK
tara:strand:+ start:233 stop:454 length:222 start_codon:yes stop_codon:yes gene_type:complete